MRDVSCLEMLCLCNPCYESSDDDGGGGLRTLVSDSEEQTDDVVPLQSPTSATCSHFELPTVDAETYYYNNYTRKVGNDDETDAASRPRAMSIRSSGFNQLLQEARETLRSEGSETSTTPRDKSRSLARFETAIQAETDLAERKKLVKEYEVFKFDHDEDNPGDSDHAALYIENARKGSAEPGKRIEYYHQAITFTNNLRQKELLMTEYKLYWAKLSK